jgi:hypothetical protein
MSETLRPSTLGEILDRTAQLYRRNFGLFAGVAVLPVGVIVVAGVAGGALVTAALATFNTKSAVGPASIALIAMVAMIAIPIYIAAAVFSYAGLTQAAVSTHRGEKLAIREVLKSVRPWFWRYLWFIVLEVILVGIVPVAIAGVVAGPVIYLASRAGAGIAAGAAVGFVVFLVIAAALGVIVWLALSYSMGFAACVVEKKPAWESLQRSWKLSKGTRGRIFVLFLLLMALSMAATMVGYLLLAIVLGASALMGNGAQMATAALGVAEIVNFVVDLIMQVLLAPVTWIALVLFYYDQRIRMEGYDIEWMMEQAGLSQPASPQPTEGTGSSWPAAPPDTVEEP